MKLNPVALPSNDLRRRQGSVTGSIFWPKGKCYQETLTDQKLIETQSSKELVKGYFSVQLASGACKDVGSGQKLKPIALH